MSNQRTFLDDPLGLWAGLPMRIEQKILPEPNSGCWIWIGANYSATGYGQITANNKWLLVHRVVYQLLKGTIPPDLEIDHLCRNRLCCNPEHLEAVTSKINALRGVSPWAQNARKEFCKRGHLLTEENTYASKRTKGKRACIICNKMGNAYRKKLRKQSERFA